MDNGSANFSLLTFFQMGGFFMWPLLAFSIATVAIALERTLYLLYHNLRMEDLKAKVLDYIKAGDMPGARDYLAGLSKRRMGARILLVLINRSRLSEQLLEKAVETEAVNCINSLENGFNFLTALGSLSPLTGFLGTVSGMIGAFKSIAEATEVNAQIVANGIYEALITTVFGLIIAIIAMVAHSLLTHVVDKFAAETEQVCSELIMELVWRRARAAAIAAAAATAAAAAATTTAEATTAAAAETTAAVKSPAPPHP
jgi:biopolymer transport protein ExbB